jgi:tetratricopeptide (TPR) repeat protein
MMTTTRKPLLVAIFGVLALFIYVSSAVYTPHSVSTKSCSWCTEEQDFYLRIPYDMARLMSLGQHGLFGTYAYLQAMYYAGKETADEQGFLPFLFLRTVEHDPFFYEGYYIGALLLGNDRQNYIDSIDLLERAERNLPDEWMFSFLRGYYLWTAFGDKEQAAEAFRQASLKPRAPIYLLTFSSTLTGHSSPQDKLRLLFEVQASIKDEQQRKKIVEMIQKLQQEIAGT